MVMTCEKDTRSKRSPTLLLALFQRNGRDIEGLCHQASPSTRRFPLKYSFEGLDAVSENIDPFDAQAYALWAFRRSP